MDDGRCADDGPGDEDGDQSDLLNERKVPVDEVDSMELQLLHGGRAGGRFDYSKHVVSFVDGERLQYRLKMPFQVFRHLFSPLRTQP